MEQTPRLVCIQCGELLNEVKCKLRCPRCGYFEDCSDGGTNLSQEIRVTSEASPRERD